MLRADAQNKIYDMYGNEIDYESDYYKFENLIDRIYDDFDSRTCENCRSNTELIQCTKGVSRPLLSLLKGYVSNPNFGCTEWAAKND